MRTRGLPIKHVNPFQVSAADFLDCFLPLNLAVAPGDQCFPERSPAHRKSDESRSRQSRSRCRRFTMRSMLRSRTPTATSPNGRRGCPGTAIVSLLPANGYVTKKQLRGYIAHNSLSVRIKDIEKAGVLAGQLLDKGANSFEGIAFDYSQKEAKYNALLGDAVRDALRKANSYVNGLGLKLGRVLVISGQRPEDGYSAGAGAVGGYAAKREAAQTVPIEPGSEVLQTEVSVTWELAQQCKISFREPVCS